MRVFLSWSGERSHGVARALKSHLETLSDELDVWESDDQLPGSEWARSLIPNIERADVAVLCLTRRNLSAPWISFELGAFYRSEFERTAIPYLLDVNKEELDFPVGMFQAVKADRRGTKSLLWRIAEQVGVARERFDRLFRDEIWRNLGDELAEIRGLDEDGRWVNVANAFFLGHDFRWTIAKLDTGASLADVQHGLRQIVHQASELGLGGTDAFRLLAVRSSPVLDLAPEGWTQDAAAELRAALQASFDDFSSIVKARQPGYTSYPPDNQDEWFRIKGRREA